MREWEVAWAKKRSASVTSLTPMTALTGVTPVLMTRHEAAQYLNISLRTLDEQIYQKEVQVVRIGRSVRLRKERLDEFITAREGQ